MGGEADFECNICLEAAHEPVVTRCGHLYCWKCIHEWLTRGQDECPSCKAGVTRENVIPLYGRGTERKDPRDSSSSSSSRPERPKAERPTAHGRRRGLFDGFGDAFGEAFEGSGGITFGIFPLGILGVWNFDGPQGATTNERFQDMISKIVVFVGCLLIQALLTR
eukprot:GEMP01078651.1.p1 GENE.GEMP01078651.1~~GEMP01078651.1.p1  ORF type:complete len:165 (+),score=45.44 GEMP01078651.1:109-603(+)